MAASGASGTRTGRVAGGQLYPEKSDGLYGGPVTERKPREIYALIANNRVNRSVALCCTALGVRREGYYAWQKRPTREERDAALVSALRQVREQHPAYGVRSMLDALPEKDKPSYGKGYRICRENGLLQRRLAPRGITKSDPTAKSNLNIRQSMERTGSCYDNARMESFFQTLKKELLYRIPLYKMTRNEVRSHIFEWIAYYNLPDAIPPTPTICRL